MEKCNYCGAEKVLNPKTGKMFCKDKCWLKPKPDPRPQGWEETGKKLGANIPKENDPILILADNFVALKDSFNSRIDELDKKIKELIELAKG